MTITEHVQPVLDRKLPAALVAGLLLCASGARADVRSAPSGDHLDLEAVSGAHPGVAVVDFGVGAATAKTFKDAFRPQVRARMIAQPWPGEPYATGIEERAAGEYRIFYLQSQSHPVIHGSDHDWSVTVHRCEADIDSALARRILDVWMRMLRAIPKNAERRGGLDGDVYNFAFAAGRRTLTGYTWSPDPGTKPYKLVHIGDTMSNYCRATQWWFAPGANWAMSLYLNHQVEELEQKLDVNK